ncbi:MAG: ATP-binding cassette domain-containing protein [Bacteroidota bacterium]
MSNTILEIKDISKNFFRPVKDGDGNGAYEKSSVLDNFSLNIEHAQLTALTGDNATGKTTLFNIISGLLKPDTGSIIYHPPNDTNHTPIPLLNLSPHKIAREGIGRMFQDNHIFESLTVMENMFTADLNMQGETAWEAIFQKKRNKKQEKKRKQKAEEMLYALFHTKNSKGLWEKRKHKAGELSEGEKRLLGLARLFMDDYYLILLDEPTSGADTRHVAKIADMIQQLDKDLCTVFMIEHDLNFVKNTAEYVAFVNDGFVQERGTPASVLNMENVKKVLSGF